MSSQSSTPPKFLTCLRHLKERSPTRAAMLLRVAKQQCQAALGRVPPVEQEKKIKQKKERDLVRVLQIINQKGNLVKERVLVRLAVKDEIREKASGQRAFQNERHGLADSASHHRRHLRQYADA